MRNYLKRLPSVAGLVQRLKPAPSAKRVEALETAFARALRRQMTETAAAEMGSTIDWQWLAHYVSMWRRVSSINGVFDYGGGHVVAELIGTHFQVCRIEPGDDTPVMDASNAGGDAEYAARLFIRGVKTMHSEFGGLHLGFEVGGEAALIFPDSPDVGQFL